jgi:two-component system sensor histidine kinase/response regulator
LGRQVTVDRTNTGIARQSVLIVDDDEILRAVMSEQIASLGWRVLSADNGESAIGVLAQHLPGMAIVDLSMPRLDGFGLLRQLRQNPRTLDLPVIVCTSHNDRESIDRAYQLGAASFITKPINWPQFLHHVQFVMRNGQTERALRAAQVEAMAASRMKNAMFQVLSHELKTPVTALIGLTDVMEKSLRGRTKDAETEQLEHVIDAASRLNGIVSDILLLSKALASSAPQQFGQALLSEILEDSFVGMKSPATAKTVQLMLRPVEADLVLHCDSHLLRQALNKLIDNAIKFSPRGAVVEVWSHVRPDGSLIISVKDSGPGLSKQKLRECLQPFIQENMTYARPAEGLGLGLPIARSICEAHGGELAIQTSPGQGLVAAIVLPASLAKPLEVLNEAKHG